MDPAYMGCFAPKPLTIAIEAAFKCYRCGIQVNVCHDLSQAAWLSLKGTIGLTLNHALRYGHLPWRRVKSHQQVCRTKSNCESQRAGLRPTTAHTLGVCVWLLAFGTARGPRRSQPHTPPNITLLPIKEPFMLRSTYTIFRFIAQ